MFSRKKSAGFKSETNDAPEKKGAGFKCETNGAHLYFANNGEWQALFREKTVGEIAFAGGSMRYNVRILYLPPNLKYYFPFLGNAETLAR